MLWGSNVDTVLESCFVLWDAPATEGLAARGCLKLSLALAGAAALQHLSTSSYFCAT